MKTILDMQIAILGAKKAKLSGTSKPDDKNSMAIENASLPVRTAENQKPTENHNSKPEVYLAL